MMCCYLFNNCKSVLNFNLKKVEPILVSFSALLQPAIFQLNWGQYSLNFFFYFFNNIGRTNVILCYQWKIDAFPKSNKKGLSFHNNSIIFHKVPMLKCSFLVVQNSKLSFFLFFHQILITLAWWSTP